MRIVDKNLVILHEKEQKQKEDNQRKTKKTNKKNQFISVNTDYPTANLKDFHTQQRKGRRGIVKEIIQVNVPELEYKCLQTTGPNLLSKWHP